MNFVIQRPEICIRKILAITLSVAAFGLAGCGGVVGETSSDSGSNNGSSGAETITPTTYTLSPAEKISSTPKEGEKSVVVSASDYGTATLTFPLVTTDSTTYNATTTSSLPFGAQNHLNDVATSAAWNAGWTGKGSQISIIDDFSTRSINSTIALAPVRRTKSFADEAGAYTAEYDVTYQLATSIAHGDLVKATAGGGFASNIDAKDVALTVKTDNTLISDKCNVTRKPATNAYFNCAGSYHDANTPAIEAKLNIRPVAGVAVEALVISNDVDLSSAQDALKTVANIQGHLLNSSNSANITAINFSLGSEIPTNNLTFSQVMGQVQKFPLKQTINAVISVAAGNGGTACAADNLNGCNALAVSLAFQPETKASTIVVGALTGTGRDQNIATYSTRGGILANRFILAPGDTGFYPNVKGTSFAAPRVAGVAAILKQKYPSLTAAQIANIILLSANKDIDNDGTVDFVGVSPIFGHGKLDLTRALALADSVAR